MSGPGPSTPQLGFRDRSGWLVFFGILEILIGGVCALFLPLILFVVVLVPRFPRDAGPGTDARFLLPSALLYAALAVFFVWMGIGTVKGRRWARTLMLVVSWIWLLCGALGVAFWFLLGPSFLAAASPSDSPLGDSVRTVALASAGVVLLFLGVVLPGSFVLFCSGKNVRATFEMKDPQPRWTDRCPAPVLTLSLLLGVCALTPVFWIPHGIFPFFGRVLRGIPAACAGLGYLLVFGFLARETYLRKMSGWWGTVVVFVLLPALALFFFRKESLAALYAEMGVDTDRLLGLQDYLEWMQSNTRLLGAAFVLINLACMLWLRKYFTPAGVGRAQSSGG